MIRDPEDRFYLTGAHNYYELQCVETCLQTFRSGQTYRKDPRFLDRQVWVNSVDPDQTALVEQSDQVLHCLPFYLHSLDKILYGKNLFV